MFAELLPVQVQQPAPMLILLRHHIGEHLCGAGIGFPQPLGDVGIDARVLLLAADGERQDFTFGQV